MNDTCTTCSQSLFHPSDGDSFCINMACREVLQKAIEQWWAWEDCLDWKLHQQLSSLFQENGLADELISNRDITCVADLYRRTESEFSEAISVVSDSTSSSIASAMVAALENSKQKPPEYLLHRLGIHYIKKLTANTLIKSYGDITLIAKASRNELVQVGGISQNAARSIRDWFQLPANQELIIQLKEVGLQTALPKEEHHPVIHVVESSKIGKIQAKFAQLKNNTEKFIETVQNRLQQLEKSAGLFREHFIVVREALQNLFEAASEIQQCNKQIQTEQAQISIYLSNLPSQATLKALENVVADSYSRIFHQITELGKQPEAIEKVNEQLRREITAEIRQMKTDLPGRLEIQESVEHISTSLLPKINTLESGISNKIDGLYQYLKELAQTDKVWIDQLSTRISKATIAALEKQDKRFKSILDEHQPDLSSQFDGIKTYFDPIKQQYSELKKKLDELHSEKISELHQRIQKQSEELRNSQLEAQRSNDHLEKAEAERDTLQQELEQCKTELRNERTARQQEGRRYQQQLDETRNTANKLQDELSIYHRLYDESSQQVQVFTQTLSPSIQSLVKIEEAPNPVGEASEHTAELQALRSTFITSMQQLQSIKPVAISFIEQLRSEQQHLINQLAEKQSFLEEVKISRNTLQSTVNQIQAQSDELKQTVHHQELNIRDLERQLQVSTEQLQETKQELKKQSSELDHNRAQALSLAGQLKEVEGDRQHWRNQHGEESKTRQVLEAKYELCCQERQKIETQLEHNKKEFTELSEEFQKTQQGLQGRINKCFEFHQGGRQSHSKKSATQPE